MNIALVAHDNNKKQLREWVDWNTSKLIDHHLVCTGTTGKRIRGILRGNILGKKVNISILQSGPLGGDQQIGAMIVENKIDALIFFWDPMEPQPHDVDVKALLRIAVLHNIAIACNRTSADMIISSPLFDNTEYTVIKYDYSSYLNRKV